MSAETILRVRCSCGRNLYDVRRDDNPNDPGWERYEVDVRRRQGVALAGFSVVPTGWGLEEAVDYSGHASHHRTYSVHCRCGLQHDRRYERIREAWGARAAQIDINTRVVHAVLDVDM